LGVSRTPHPPLLASGMAAVRPAATPTNHNSYREGIMKQEARKWLARSAFVALVAIGTLMAGPRIPQPATVPIPARERVPRWGWGSPDTRQPDTFCPNACAAQGWTDGGSCVVGCCVCYM
jgi:hypothetical protein